MKFTKMRVKRKKNVLTSRTEKKNLQFNMHCKAIGRNLDCGCRYLQDTYNGAAFKMALPLQKLLCNFQCYEYHLDSLLMCLMMPDLSA